MPQGNMFSRSNHAKMMSSAITDQNQGGGDKKAGLVPRVAKDHWFAIYSKPASVGVMSMTMFPHTRQNRPVYGRPQNYVGAGGRF